MGLFDGLLGGGKKKERRPRPNRKTRTAIPKKTAASDGADENKDDEDIADVAQEEEISLDSLDSLSSSPQKNKVPPKKVVDSSSTTIISPERRKPPRPGQLVPGKQMDKKLTSTSSRRKRTSITKKRIGNLLVSANVINENQLEKALKIQGESGGLLGQILIEMGACNAGNVGAALNKQRTITTVELDKVKFGKDALSMLSREVCDRLRLIPFQKIGPLLCVAMSNVLDSNAKKEIRDITQAKIKPFDSSWQEISDAIEKYYDSAVASGDVEVAKDMPEDETVDSQPEGEEDLVNLDDEFGQIDIELPDEEEPPSDEIPKIDDEGVIVIEDEAPQQDSAEEQIISTEETVDEVIELDDGVIDADSDTIDVVDLGEISPVEEVEDLDVIDLADDATVDEVVEEVEDGSDVIEVVDDIEPVEDLEVVDDLELVEDIEELELVDEPSEVVAEAAGQAGRAVVEAIPLTDEYLREVTASGTLSVRLKWLNNIKAEKVIPAENSFNGKTGK